MEERPWGISIFKKQGEEKKSPKKTKVKSQLGEHANTDPRARAGIASQERLNTTDTLCRGGFELKTETCSMNLTEERSP